MGSKEIAEIATRVMDDNPDESTEWCIATAAAECGCSNSAIISALTSHPEISGFKEKTP